MFDSRGSITDHVDFASVKTRDGSVVRFPRNHLHACVSQRGPAHLWARWHFHSGDSLPPLGRRTPVLEDVRGVQGRRSRWGPGHRYIGSPLCWAGWAGTTALPAVWGPPWETPHRAVLRRGDGSKVGQPVEGTSQGHQRWGQDTRSSKATRQSVQLSAETGGRWAEPGR